MPESYQPGQRNPRFAPKKPGRYTGSRYAWCKTEIGQFIILVGDTSKETGDDVVLFHPKPGKMPDVVLPLTNLTMEELDVFKQLVNDAIEWARPIVKLRDEEAQNAYDNGDDSFVRIYRQVPQLVYRKRPGDEHSEGVQLGPDGVPEGERVRGDSDGGVRRAGNELAEPSAEQAEPEDDQPTVD